LVAAKWPKKGLLSVFGLSALLSHGAVFGFAVGTAPALKPVGGTRYVVTAWAGSLPLIVRLNTVSVALEHKRVEERGSDRHRGGKLFILPSGEKGSSHPFNSGNLGPREAE
jgi:hypothetical protein